MGSSVVGIIVFDVVVGIIISIHQRRLMLLGVGRSRVQLMRLLLLL